MVCLNTVQLKRKPKSKALLLETAKIHCARPFAASNVGHRSGRKRSQTTGGEMKHCDLCRGAAIGSDFGRRTTACVYYRHRVYSGHLSHSTRAAARTLADSLVVTSRVLTQCSRPIEEQHFCFTTGDIHGNATSPRTTSSGVARGKESPL